MSGTAEGKILTGPQLPPVDDRTEAWMQAKRRKIVDARVRAQLEASRRRHARRALITLADIEALLSR